MTPKVKTFLERLFSTVVLLSLLGAAVGFNEPAGYAVLICLFCNLTTVEWHNMLRSRAETTSRLSIRGSWRRGCSLTMSGSTGSFSLRR